MVPLVVRPLVSILVAGRCVVRGWDVRWVGVWL